MNTEQTPSWYSYKVKLAAKERAWLNSKHHDKWSVILKEVIGVNLMQHSGNLTEICHVGNDQVFKRLVLKLAPPQKILLSKKKKQQPKNMTPLHTTFFKDGILCYREP